MKARVFPIVGSTFISWLTANNYLCVMSLCGAEYPKYPFRGRVHAGEGEGFRGVSRAILGVHGYFYLFCGGGGGRKILSFIGLFQKDLLSLYNKICFLIVGKLLFFVYYIFRGTMWSDFNKDLL